MGPMLIAWTTLSTRADAEKLAADVVAGRLAACAQVDGPIASHFVWQGRAERAEEFRVSIKFLPSQLTALEAFVLERHPYDTPEWVVVSAERVGEKYLSWMKANSTPLPL